MKTLIHTCVYVGKTPPVSLKNTYSLQEAPFTQRGKCALGIDKRWSSATRDESNARVDDKRALSVSREFQFLVQERGKSSERL